MLNLIKSQFNILDIVEIELNSLQYYNDKMT